MAGGARMHEGSCKPLKERERRQRRKPGDETDSNPAVFGTGERQDTRLSVRCCWNADEKGPLLIGR